MPDVAIERIDDGLFLASRPLDEGIDVRAALLIGATRAVVIDTLTRPADMIGFAEIIRERRLPCTVIDTHADWDHAWGNGAFPQATIVGHARCRMRLLSAAARDELRRKSRERPGFFDAVRLVPPTATFETEMTVDAGGLEVQLHHVPGHTADSIVVYVPKRQTLFVGDCAESPFPLLESGPLDEWIAHLRAWARADVTTVIPAHGPISGPELLDDNAAYLGALRSAPPSPVDAPEFYVEAHRRNVDAARSNVI